MLQPHTIPKLPNGEYCAKDFKMAIIRQDTGLTFDDVLLRPALSEVLPSEVDVTTNLTRSIKLNIPIISAAMDTVTEGALAIAMAQAGGIGVIHRNLTPEIQAQHIRQVKKFESGMVVNPVTIAPNSTLKDALRLMDTYRISGIPVVEAPPMAATGAANS